MKIPNAPIGVRMSGHEVRFKRLYGGAWSPDMRGFIGGQMTDCKLLYKGWNEAIITREGDEVFIVTYRRKGRKVLMHLKCSYPDCKLTFRGKTAKITCEGDEVVVATYGRKGRKIRMRLKLVPIVKSR